jgi:ABC-type polar amino acid transport system ATPase subunit
MEISVENLTKRYGDKTILDGVSVRLAAGKTVALIGPSGGGKSTLLRCLNGLCHFESGAVRVGPHRLAAAPNDPKAALRGAAPVRRLLGMIFQDCQLFPHQTALQNVMEAPMRVLGLPYYQARARGLELLRQVGLEDRACHFPRQLSGGQKQRVAIARALAMEPKGLLCDEITSALDPRMKKEVLSVLTELKQQGLTLVMVTHEIGFARRAADHVVLLAGGRVAEEGPPEQVLDAPQTEVARQFLAEVLG